MININPLLEQATAYREAVGTAASLATPEQVKTEIARRKVLRVQIREAKAMIANEVGDLQALKKLLDIADQYQSIDIDHLTDVTWELIRDRKASETSINPLPEIV